MTDWTPGPWTTKGFRIWEQKRVHAERRGIVAEAALSWHSSAEAQANARLIAAAPDLYTALEALEPHLDAIVCYASTQSEHAPNKLVADVRAALAKARGETE